MFITGLWLVFVQNTHLTTVSVLCYSWFTHEVRVSQKSVLCSFWFLHEVRVILISVLCYCWFNCQVLVWLVPVLCYHWFIHQVLCNQFCLTVPLVCSPSRCVPSDAAFGFCNSFEWRWFVFCTAGGWLSCSPLAFGLAFGFLLLLLLTFTVYKFFFIVLFALSVWKDTDQMCGLVLSVFCGLWRKEIFFT